MNTSESLLISEAIFFKKLVMNEVMHDRYWDSKSNRAKYIIRSLLMPKSTFKVLGFLATNPDAKRLMARQPSLPYKVHRPYLRANLKTKDKIKSICEGSRLIFTSLESSVYKKIYSSDGLQLAKIEGKNGDYTIKMGMENKFSREGELVLNLRNSEGITLASCAFGFVFENDMPCLFIGAMQGGEKLCTPELIKEATKSCYGLFPKRILIEIVCFLANKFECSKILAVSNKTHIFQSGRYKKRKSSLMLADYDGFWESLSGHRNAKNDYELPLEIKRKDIEEVTSKKRSEYRKRYVLLDDLKANLITVLN
ncbi:VirK/YbjX family protein [Rouxiella sp. WC2420]|uniref:VirK/YbjX family protein n=1 Tax=Rouxiella sp. WC2420 TaxID=3234145 RepID=A0AB39VX06_9GAMM